MKKKYKPRGYWTEENCVKSAKQYETRHQWAKADPSAYTIAKSKGYMDACCDHMISRSEAHSRARTKWGLAECKADALNHQTRKGWERANPPAYRRARLEGYLSECCSHMEYAPTSTDNDVIYIWRDAGTDLHKVGITSARIGEDRIGICGRHNGMDPRIVLMLKVADARAVESKLLELGTDPELDKSIDGHTEFRELTNDDLREAVSIAYSAAIAA